MSPWTALGWMVVVTFGLVLLALIYGVATAIVDAQRQKKLRREMEDRFKKVVGEVGDGEVIWHDTE